MDQETATQSERAGRRRGRPWWQWMLGVGLIAAAGVHYWTTNRPKMVGRPLEVPPQPLRLSPDLTEADVLPAAPGSLAGCNVLLVTLDTARADRVGCYGNANIQTPNLDRLAAEGVIFSRAVTTAPTTLPSHASIHTGLYPYHHGARANGVFHLDSQHATLAETLATRGYITAAFISAFVLDRSFGLDQGFALYDDEVNAGPSPDPFRYEERSAQHTTDRAIKWLRGLPEGAFFAWVHYFDPHAKYAPPPPFAEQYATRMYDGEIAYVDHELGRLLAVVDELGHTERTLVVVVGDHGEALWWRDEPTHGHLVYEPTAAVPLILRCGDRLGGGVHLRQRVSQVDLMPTILSLLGVPCPDGVDGVNLAAPWEDDRAVVAENLNDYLEYGWHPLIAVYQGPYKYIWGPAPELYDLTADPLESQDLCPQKPEVAATMLARLKDSFGDDLGSAMAAKPTHELTDDAAAKLAAIGYTLRAATTLPPLESCPDPRRMLPVLLKVEQVVFTEVEDDDLDKAIPQLEALAEEHPDFFPVFKYLGFMYRRAGRVDQAEEAFRRCLSLHPGAADAQAALALTLAMNGDNDGAIDLLEQVVADHPQYFQTRLHLGRALLEDGRAAEASVHLAAAFNLNPTDKKCLAAMMQAHATANRLEEVREVLRAKLVEQPRLPAARAALAENLTRAERIPEALEVLREGAELMPDDPEAVGNYSLLLVQVGGSEFRSKYDAVEMLEKLCERGGYADPQALFRLATVYLLIARTDEAQAMAERALTLATDTGNEELIAVINNLITNVARAKEAQLAAPPGQPGGQTP